jgi:hypothetical protein
VNANERDEIAASVAAHTELGPRYDDAVAEGLVERIGEEIDKRIDARLGERRRPAENSPQVPPGYRAPTGPLPAMPVATPPPAPVHRRSGGLSGVVLGLGSMGIGIGATAVIVGNKVDAVAAVLMVVLIWAAIAAINIAHSQRKL